MAENPNIKQETNAALGGMILNKSVSQIPKGFISYGLNAVVENLTGEGVSYQNELGNELCVEFPQGYQLIGKHFIVEQGKQIFFLANPSTGESEIGYMDNGDCVYRKYINAACLGFDIAFPIHKVIHKLTNCTTEIYWTDGHRNRRFLDLNNLPFKTKSGTDVCDKEDTDEIDCNKLSVQPNFNIPALEVTDVISGGNLTAGTVQFAVQYSDANGNGYTSYYSVTNPVPIADTKIVTADFNYPVGKSVVLNISNLDITGYFQYFNLAVIKTVNNIPSVELVGTYFIDSVAKQIVYTGQNQTQIRLTISDIFEKFPYYELADDLTTVQDVLVWKGLTSIDRINYQQIANKITLQWESWRIPNTEDYSDELNATNLRGYLRDEVYPFEIVFLLSNGKQTDGFHIPGRAQNANEFSHPDVDPTNPDYIGDPSQGSLPYWKVYNTASVIGTDSGYSAHSSYKGPYQYGHFAYWESLDVYPCNTDVWGELAGTPIRHHKFPDVLVSPIFENPVIELDSSGRYTDLAIQKDAIFPIGVKINAQQVQALISQSNLTTEQKDAIVGFKIVRGNRDVNKSVIAKGILRNVGKYEREGTEYYFPNYPYNDLREDPFLLAQSNAYNAECITYEIVATSDGRYEYTDCFTNTLTSAEIANGETVQVCSLTTPNMMEGTSTITEIGYDIYTITVGRTVFGTGGYVIVGYKDFLTGEDAAIKVSSGQTKNIQVEAATTPTIIFISGAVIPTIRLSNESSGYSKNLECYPDRLNAFSTDDSRYRHVLNSPETSFGQPFLGEYLKLESVIFGAGKAHFVEVKNNAQYKLITKEAQQDALDSSAQIADITATFDPTAMFTAYQAYLQIYLNGITRRNYAWSYNSIASYDYYASVENGDGVKQRMLDNSQYLIPAVQSVGDTVNINNYQRESSVYLKTTEDYSPLPFPSESPALVAGSISLVEDRSRFINSEIDCSQPEEQFDISVVSYYGSLKNIFPNQWGQIYSYETIDTGFQIIFSNDPLEAVGEATIFGGDTFINKFSFKTKLPFFIDNRVGAPDDSDVFYDEIGNVAYPEYWHSARSVLFDYIYGSQPTFKNIISIKAHNFDCPNSQFPAPDETATPPIVNPNRTFYDGKMYMFAYGIPTFYCESSINVDLRQAFNNREGDFYPHVTTGIPDDWVQESFVPIVQDNTYYYNVTFSKQNKENLFTHLPIDWEEKLCFTNFPFRAIYSEQDDEQTNGWLVYGPSAYFDFPQNYGELTSLDGIENRQVLARFENKSLLYNALYTTQTNVQGQVYLGQGLFSATTPPLDYAETDLGYVGSQHKFLLKIPQGQITADAKRGQIFLLSGNTSLDISALSSGLNTFLKNHLPFEILTYYPDIDIDNHFNGIGLHGVYDNKYNRVIISKLDYTPLTDAVKWDSETNEFYIEHVYPQNTTTSTTTFSEEVTTTSTTTIEPLVIRERVYLTDPAYFCNKSWTLSYNMDTKSWISFHTYIPNWYIGDNNFFYSGINEGCDLEIVALQEVPSTTTTSTTTVNPYDCEIEGTAMEVEGGVLITITSAGADTGPFNLYSNIDGFIIPFETNVSKLDLEAGFVSANVPEATEVIRIRSNNVLCTSYTDIEIVTTTTTSSSSTTSTSSTTTTTSTTTVPEEFDYYLSDQYNCSSCLLEVTDVVVAVPTGESITINNYYQTTPLADKVYRIKSSTTGPSSVLIDQTVTTADCAGTPLPCA